MTSGLYSDIEIDFDRNQIITILEYIGKIYESIEEKDLWMFIVALEVYIFSAEKIGIEVKPYVERFSTLLNKMLHSQFLEARVIALEIILEKIERGEYGTDYSDLNQLLLNMLDNLSENLTVSDEYIVHFSQLKKAEDDDELFTATEDFWWNDLGITSQYNPSLHKYSNFHPSNSNPTIKVEGDLWRARKNIKKETENGFVLYQLKKGEYFFEEIITNLGFFSGVIQIGSNWYEFFTQFELYTLYPKLLISAIVQIFKEQKTDDIRSILKNVIHEKWFLKILIDEWKRLDYNIHMFMDFLGLSDELWDFYPELRTWILYHKGYPVELTKKYLEEASERQIFILLTDIEHYLMNIKEPDKGPDISSIFLDIFGKTEKDFIRRTILGCLAFYPNNRSISDAFFNEISRISESLAMENDLDEYKEPKGWGPRPIYGVLGGYHPVNHTIRSYIGTNIITYGYDEQEIISQSRGNLFVQLYMQFQKSFLEEIVKRIKDEGFKIEENPIILYATKFWINLWGHGSFYKRFMDCSELIQFVRKCYLSGTGMFTDSFSFMGRMEGSENFHKPSVRIPVSWLQQPSNP